MFSLCEQLCLVICCKETLILVFRVCASPDVASEVAPANANATVGLDLGASGPSR